MRVEPRACVVCGKTFKPRDNYKPGKTCSMACKFEAQKKPPTKQPCERCGEMFTPDRPSRTATFCSRKCAAEALGASRPNRRIDVKGYVLIWAPNHPHTTRSKYMMEHRLIVEAHLGRYLKPSEVVHHRNGNKADNHFKNLELMTKGAHDRKAKPRRKVMECPHCHGKIGVSVAARRVTAL